MYESLCTFRLSTKWSKLLIALAETHLKRLAWVYGFILCDFQLVA